MRFEVIKGETEHVTFRGRRIRNPTVLIRVGRISLSRQALIVGAALAIFQVLDALLTYAGLRCLGVDMEGNGFLRSLMTAYGTAPALVVVKMIALIFVCVLTLHAHTRRWMRPVIVLLSLIYLALAVVPWTYIISHHVALSGREEVDTDRS
jgi:uncharacterized membrane protein